MLVMCGSVFSGSPDGPGAPEIFTPGVGGAEPAGPPPGASRKF